jgi:hypothetical protein
VTHPPPPGGLSYRGSLGLGLVPSAAPGGPTGHLADHTRQQPMGSASAAAGQSVPSAQQQQQGFPHGSLGSGADGFGHGSLLGPGSLMQQQQQGLMGLQQQPGSAGAGLVGGASLSSSGGSGKGLMPAGLSLFQGASYDSPLTGPLMGGNSSTGTAVGGGALSPYPSPMHRWFLLLFRLCCICSWVAAGSRAPVMLSKHGWWVWVFGMRLHSQQLVGFGLRM